MTIDTNLPVAKPSYMEGLIRRAKLYSPRFMVQWKWNYTVELRWIEDGAAPDTISATVIGTRLDEAKSWAKRHGATKIVKSWEQA